MPTLSIRISDELAEKIDARPGSRSATIRRVLEEAMGMEPTPEPKVGRPPKSATGPRPKPPDPLHVQAANQVPKPEPTLDDRYTGLTPKEAKIRQLRDELIAEHPARADTARKRAMEQLGFS